MPLQFNVSSVDDLAPEVAALYVPDAEHGYRLDVIEPEAIRKALAAERDSRKSAERSARTAEQRAAEAARDLSKAQHERDVEAAKAAKLRGTLLELQVRRVAQAVGLHPCALRDAARAAAELFDVGDDGELKPKDGKGTLDAWLEATKEESPHWWPATGSGSGSPQGGSARSARRGDTMSRRQFEALAPEQRTALIREGQVTITD